MLGSVVVASYQDYLCPQRELCGVIKPKYVFHFFQVRPVDFGDFEKALCQVRASVSSTDLHAYVEWNSMYGSIAAMSG